MDVYVSHKKRKKNKSAFHFVRFKYKQDAVKAMENLDGTIIRQHNRIKESIVKFSKEGQDSILSLVLFIVQQKLVFSLTFIDLPL